jgi:3-methyladenine DNA glycosylase AlkD
MTLSTQIREALAAVADPARAPKMQAYMKSAMPYLGVAAAPARAVCKALFKDLRYADSTAWQADVLSVWRGAQFREEYYAAIDLAGIRAARDFQHMDALPMYREMIETGTWWDVVDAIAAHPLGAILKNDRAEMTKTMLAWSRDDNMWLRRSAIICQNRAKGAVDLELLYACIEPSLDSKAFFLRKAIGWALREVAWHNPDEVRRYVAENEGRMSGLSKREALKNISPKSSS